MAKTADRHRGRRRRPPPGNAKATTAAQVANKAVQVIVALGSVAKAVVLVLELLARL